MSAKGAGICDLNPTVEAWFKLIFDVIHVEEECVMAGAMGDRTVLLPGSGVVIGRVPMDAPYEWLSAGWRDMWSAPHVSLSYGLAFAALAVVMALGLAQAGMESLMLALGGGFLLIGPIVAVGLYETSRRLEAGHSATLLDAVGAVANAPGQLGFFGVILGFAFFVWIEIAFLLLMLFQGTNAVPPPDEFVSTLLFTAHGRSLLIVGTLVGGLLAAVVFSISVISAPLLLTHKIDAVSAMSASLEAVVRNPAPMLLWAVLIAVLMAVGIGTACLGFVLIFPLIGHATWHAYRALVSDVRP